MSRDRLTGRNNRKQSRRERTADPYTMNVERTNPPTEDYMTGDPSAWAEDPVADLGRMDGTKRNELGLPEVDDTTWNHQDASDWNSGGSYDNEGGKLAASEARVRLAEMQRHFEKKALQCIRIARALFPTASDAVIQEQALDFMPLPDDSVIATALRLAEEEDSKEDEKEKEEESKEASLTPDQMLRQMLAEADEDEKEEEEESKEAAEEEEEEEKEEKESKKAKLLEMARKLIQAAADEDDDSEEEEESKEAAEDEDDSDEDEEEADEEVESKKKSSADDILSQLMVEAGMEEDMMMDDVPMDMDAMDEPAPMGDDLDMMMAEMEEDMGYEATAELGIDLTPNLDQLDAQALLESSDEVLQQLMSRQTTEAPKTASQKGVSQLGRVKEASSTGDSDLSKLWKSAPDVSSAFE